MENTIDGSVGRDVEDVLDRMFYNETVEIELDFKMRTMAAELRHLEEERLKLARERLEFDRYRESETRRLAQANELFENKWKILEEETMRLADERRRVDKQRSFYEKVKREVRMSDDISTVGGDMFFIGVQNEVALKRRYRDLLKIYHPDNLNGDTGTIQEINREYRCLKQKFA